MKIPKYDAGRDSGANMTPMIDVVFLLIIFFLVSSHLARRENEIPLSLPEAASGEELADATHPRLTLNVLANGELLLAGNSVPPQKLASHFLTARNREGADLELRIRSDRRAPYRNVSPILSAAAESGIWNVTFSVLHPRGS